MEVRVLGNEKNPLLVCVHGLMGDVHDFDYYIDQWTPHFQLVLPGTYNQKGAHDAGYSQVDANGVKRLLYESAPQVLAEYIKSEFPGRSAYFAGISLGGKITIEVAGTYPEVFKGAVVTDVGLGPLCSSDLFDFMSEVVPNINLNQPWTALRQELNQQIPDKMLRLLVQSHLEFPDQERTSAQWRSSSLDFPTLVSGTTLEDQWHLQDKIVSPVHILKATVASAISDEDFARMKANSKFSFRVIPGANHFIQVYNKEIFSKETIDFITACESGNVK